MARRWMSVASPDLTGPAELDPDRDAELLLSPSYDGPLLDGDDDADRRYQLELRRWTAWLAS
ncbi:MAG: hypothetical protein WD794_09160 [Mycobacteriales bacterium]